MHVYNLRLLMSSSYYLEMHQTTLHIWKSLQHEISSRLSIPDSTHPHTSIQESNECNGGEVNSEILKIRAKITDFSFEENQVDVVTDLYSAAPFIENSQRYSSDDLSHQIKLLYKTTFAKISNGLCPEQSASHPEEDCDIIVGGLDMTAIPQYIVDKATEVACSGSSHASAQKVKSWFPQDVLARFRAPSSGDNAPVPGESTAMSDWSVVSLCVHRYRGSRCERVWARDVVVRSAVPYHSGFLSFREAIPLMRVLLECYCDSLSGACCWPDVLVVDGNGRLHPQAGGLASHVAYMTRTPTVGVAKTLCHTDGLSRELSRGLRDCVDSRLVAGAWRRREEPGPLQETQETQAADAGDISSSAAFPALLELLLDQYRGQPAPEEPAAARPALPRASAEDLSALLSAAHDALATGRAAATLPAPCFPLLARSSLTLPPPGQPAAGAVLGEVLGLGVHAGLLHALQDTLGRTLKAGAKAGAAPVSPSAALARAVEEVARTNPVYVSVGAYVGLADALLLVLATSPCRVPESTRSADISGRAMVREIRSACSL